MFLDAALATTAEQGIEAVTARSLAAAIGYSPGTIYQVFENLDDVVAQLKAAILDQLIGRLDAAPARGAPRQRMLALSACRPYSLRLSRRRFPWKLALSSPAIAKQAAIGMFAQA